MLNSSFVIGNVVFLSNTGLQIPAQSNTNGRKRLGQVTVGGATGRVVFAGDAAGATGGGAAVVIRGSIRSSGNSAAVTVNAVIRAILSAQLRGGIPGALHLGRCLLSDFDGGQSIAAVYQVSNQDNVSYIIGVQAVTKLQAIRIGCSSHADIGGNLRNGIGGLTIHTPAPGNESGAVRGIIHGGGGIVGGAGRIEHTAGGICSGKEVLNGYIVSNVRTGVNRLSVGNTVGTAGIERIVIIPAVNRALASPGQIIKIICTGNDIVLRGCSCICLLFCNDSDSRQQAQNKNDT